MPQVSAITGMPVLRPDGKRAGRVEHVLFHAKDPHVVGFEVERPALLGVLRRSTRFMALDQGEISEDGRALEIAFKRFPSPAVAARNTGVDWDKTVIWRSMEVRTRSGEELGRVADAVFGRTSGKITKLMLTEGAATDAGVGRRTLEGDKVVGFDGTYVIVDDSAAERPTGGGVATAAGVGSAVVKDVVGRAAGKAARSAGRLAGKTIRRAKQSTKEWKDLLGGEK